MEMNPASIDINIHPTKTEVKFEDEKSDDDEIVVSELQSVNKLQFLKVSSS